MPRGRGCDASPAGRRSPGWAALDVTWAATRPGPAVLARLGSREEGLTADEAAQRRAIVGPNSLPRRRPSAWRTLGRELRSPLLVLLVGSATVSFFVGERTDAVIIGVILLLSVGLGFVNDFRAERAADALHSRIRHRTTVRRDGHHTTIDVGDLVPGDVVELRLGELVPADLRLLDTRNLACDESVLTGESSPAEKSPAGTTHAVGLGDLSSCALMGTVVSEGSGTGVVVATGRRTAFGRIAQGLTDAAGETDFERGLRDFSRLLVRVAALLVVAISAVNLALRRPMLDALLFALAIAVGITPQLLPAVVTASLATGSRQLARRKVLVKRLVSIEDLGNVDVLFTDKTGTLTEGRVTFDRAVAPDGSPAPELVSLGLLCNEARVENGRAVAGNELDVALWDAVPEGTAPPGRVVAVAPFDHDRRLVSVLAEGTATGRMLITKGAPEAVLGRSSDVPDGARSTLDALFAEGRRVVAVATRAAPALTSVDPADEHDLRLAGFLCFVDRPKGSARSSLDRLAALGVSVRVVTGDNPVVAATVCRDLGITVEGTITGDELDALDDAALAGLLDRTTVFARVNPEQKARVVRAQRQMRSDVAFLGDGVNDALALHEADVGISVDSATDVAKDAADIVLLAKDLGVVADGISEGRRIFANTIKYVLMSTSSNFGNMFSAAAASAFLSFLPMLPSQILLNNLLYDTSQMVIPTDRVDPEVVRRPAHWDVDFIRRFMTFFGPISSLFDFVTFGVLLWVFDAGPPLFRAVWFVESLATQALVIFVIRTRRIPFLASRPSRTLTSAASAVVVVGALLPISPLASPLGFARPPATAYLTIALLAAAYLGLAEAGKAWFFRERPDSAGRERHARHRWRARRHDVRARRRRSIARRVAHWGRAGTTNAP